LPEARKGVRNGEGDSETRPGIKQPRKRLQNEEEKSKERDYKRRKRFRNSLLLNLFFKFLFFNHF